MFTWEQVLEWSFNIFGFPKPNQPGHVIEWQDEKQFGALLRQGRPLVLALTIPGCSPCTQMKRVLESASIAFNDKGIRFVQVDCSKAERFCRTRHPDGFPHVEVFYNIQASKSETEGKTKLSMKTTLYDYDRSVYGFQEFFKLHGILRDDESAQTPAAHVNTEK